MHLLTSVLIFIHSALVVSGASNLSHTEDSLSITGSGFHNSGGYSYVYVGDTLQVNCTLSNPDRFRSHDVVIILDSPRQCEEDVCQLPGVEINNHTKQFNTLVTGEQNSGEYICWINGAQRPFYSHSLFVYVQYPPQGVRDISCIVHDWTTSLECSWHVGVQYIENDMEDPDVIVQAYLSPYLSYSKKLHWESCPEGDTLNRRQCIWSGEKFLTYRNYVLLVNVTNTVTGNVNTTYHNIIRNDIVKPLHVDKIRIHDKNSSCASMAWNNGRRWTKVFRVNITIEEKSLSEIVNTTNISFCGLMPYTLYEVSVETRASHGNGTQYGYWSDPLIHVFTTAESVPSSSFEVPSGSYELHTCDESGRRNVTLFLKAVPPHQRNGKIIGYHMVYNGTEVDVSVPSPTSALVQNVSCEDNITVNIFSKTKVGRSKTNAMITILPDKAKSTLDLAVNVSGGRLRSVTWNISSNVSEEGEEDNVTIFWCLKNLTAVDETCQDELQWKTTAYKKGEMHIPSQPHPPKHFRYGISHQGRGISWTTCLFDLQVPMQPVKVEAYAKKDSFSIRWRPQPCSSDYPVHVTSYRITTCQQQHCDGTMHQKEVEGGQMSHYRLSGEQGVKYKVTVQAQDSSGRLSPPSDPVITQIDTTTAQSSKWVIGVVVIVLFLLLIGLLVGGWKCWQHYQHSKSKFARDMDFSEHKQPVQSGQIYRPVSSSSEVSFPNPLSMVETGMSTGTELTDLLPEPTEWPCDEMSAESSVQGSWSDCHGHVSSSRADHMDFIVHPDTSQAAPATQSHGPSQMAPSTQHVQPPQATSNLGYTPLSDSYSFTPEEVSNTNVNERLLSAVESDYCSVTPEGVSNTNGNERLLSAVKSDYCSVTP